MMYTDKKVPIKHTIEIPQKTTTTTTTTQQHQRIILAKFMIRTFITGIKLNYSSLFINEIDTTRSSLILETILKRSGASILLFKKACCVVIKFLRACVNRKGVDRGVNSMKNLHYDLHKLLVAAFVICTTSTYSKDTPIQDYEKWKSQRWYITCKSYSVITGLSVDEIANCCTIVKMVLNDQSHLGTGDEVTRHRHSYDRRIIGNGKMDKPCVVKGDIDEFNKMSKALVAAHFKVI